MAGGHQLGDAIGKRPGLGEPPRRGHPIQVPVRALVHQHQLHRGLLGGRRRRGCALAPGQQRPEARAQLGGEGRVDGGEDLGAAAEVGLQRLARPRRLQPLAAALEQLHLGVAEAVDRLLGVPDREQVVSGDGLDQLQLHPVGVLKLVHHDPGKPARVALAQLAIGGEQATGDELEVLEVQPRHLTLAPLVVAPIGLEQLVQQVADRSGGDGRAASAKASERLGVAHAGVGAEGRAVAWQPRGGQVGRPHVAGGDELQAALDPPQGGHHGGAGLVNRP